MPHKAVGRKRSKTVGTPALRLVEKLATRTGRVPLTEVQEIVRRMLETQLRSRGSIPRRLPAISARSRARSRSAVEEARTALLCREPPIHPISCR